LYFTTFDLCLKHFRMGNDIPPVSSIPHQDAECNL
jgi:hypothetical protein